MLFIVLRLTSVGSLQRPNMTGPKGANTEGPKGATTDGPSVAGCAFLLWATGGCLQWAPCGRHIGSLVGQYVGWLTWFGNWQSIRLTLADID